MHIQFVFTLGVDKFIITPQKTHALRPRQLQCEKMYEPQMHEILLLRYFFIAKGLFYSFGFHIISMDKYSYNFKNIHVDTEKVFATNYCLKLRGIQFLIYTF